MKVANIKRAAKPSLKATAFAETEQILSKSNAANTADDINTSVDTSIPSLKLKIKLPQQQQQQTKQEKQNQGQVNNPIKKTKKKALKRKKGEKDKGRMSSTASVMSKKMRESLALNRASSSSDSR